MGGLSLPAMVVVTAGPGVLSPRMMRPVLSRPFGDQSHRRLT